MGDAQFNQRILLPGDPTVNLHAATKQYVDTSMSGSSAAPVGTVIAYAGSSIPAGWLLCYGQAVSRTTYAALFSVISTTYGAGDGSTTFNLPDLRGRGLAGVDNMGGSAANRITSATSGITGTTLGAAGGDQRLHTHGHGTTGNDSPDHGHSMQITRGGSVNDQGGNGGYLWHNNWGTNSAGANARHQHSVGNNTQGGTAQNVQPTMMMNYIIKFDMANPAAWSSYTPTLTASTTNPTGWTQTGYYIQSGKLITAQFSVVAGASMTAGSGQYRIALPTAARAVLSAVPCGTLELFDTSASDYRTAVGRIASGVGSYLTVFYSGVNTNNAQHAAPWAWANGDFISGTITYEAA